MRLLILLFFAISASAKINLKALTESMGQEVIEIGAPIKELSPDIEEEPSAEIDEVKTTTTIQVATTKDFKKVKSDPSKKIKDIDKIDGKKQDDEEARIEKELAEIYKDSVDYKSDSFELTPHKPDSAEESAATEEANTTETIDKPIARSRTHFKFQPDSNNPKDVESFRTSVDEINCDKVRLIGTSLGQRRANDGGVRKSNDVYSDYDDYKTDMDGETIEDTNNVTEDFLRAKTKKTTTKHPFKFQPDANDPKDVARFRTSQDHLNCEMLKLAGTTEFLIPIDEDRNSSGFSNCAVFTLIFICLMLSL